MTGSCGINGNGVETGWGGTISGSVRTEKRSFSAGVLPKPCAFPGWSAAADASARSSYFPARPRSRSRRGLFPGDSIPRRGGWNHTRAAKGGADILTRNCRRSGNWSRRESGDIFPSE